MSEAEESQKSPSKWMQNKVKIDAQMSSKVHAEEQARNQQQNPQVYSRAGKDHIRKTRHPILTEYTTKYLISTEQAKRLVSNPE